MSEKEEDSLSSEQDDSRHVTLANALEEAFLARDSALKIKSEMFEELERFRAAMRDELKVRNRKFDLHDALLFGGLATTAAGITVAYHWAYALMFVGGTLIALSVISLFRRAVKA